MARTIFQFLRPQTTYFLTLIITLLCLSTIIFHPATGLPITINLVRRQSLLSPTLSLPPHFRRLDTKTQEAAAEAGVVIAPKVSIRQVEAEAEEAVEENAKRGLSRTPGGGRPGSGTYYPGQPYGRRDVDDASS